MEDNLVSNSTEGKTVQIQLMVFTFKDFIFHPLLRSIQCNEHFYSRYFKIIFNLDETLCPSIKSFYLYDWCLA